MATLDLSFDDSSFSGELPLFPLPGSVLLPGGLLPLHVFEPRYREMVRDALAGERLIAMALLCPGYEEDYQGNPQIREHVCVGRITMENQLPDGRWTFVLVGLRRARILEEDQTRSYRRAQVELRADLPLSDDEEQRGVSALTNCLGSLPPEIVRDAQRLAIVLRLLQGEVPAAFTLGAALDLAADAVLLGLEDRVALLATPDVPARVALFVAQVERRRQELALLRRGNTGWPPKFSLN